MGIRYINVTVVFTGDERLDILGTYADDLSEEEKVAIRNMPGKATGTLTRRVPVYD